MYMPQKIKILKFSYTALQEVFLPILQNRLFRITVWFSELVSDENWAVKHDYTETLEGLAAMRGSKYVQSRIGSTYQQAKDFLEAGRLVLFSGTPCQIRGLKLFLAKEYENLLTVDLVCHGVPSPEIWRQYLHEIIATGGADIQIPSCGPHPKLRVSISGTRRPDGKATVCGSHSAERPGSVFRRRQTYPEYTIRIHSFTASCRM